MSIKSNLKAIEYTAKGSKTVFIQDNKQYINFIIEDLWKKNLIN